MWPRACHGRTAPRRPPCGGPRWGKGPAAGAAGAGHYAGIKELRASVGAGNRERETGETGNRGPAPAYFPVGAALRAAIQASMCFSSTDSGTEPVSSTASL